MNREAASMTSPYRTGTAATLVDMLVWTGNVTWVSTPMQSYRQFMGAWCPGPMEENVLEPPVSFWNIPVPVKISLTFYFFPSLAKMPLLGIKGSASRMESKLSTSE